MNRGAYLSVAVAFAVARGMPAQDSGAVKLRLSLEEGATVGRAAPPIVLPYATADSAGPASQPFDLAKELGHVVVLIFYPGNAAPASADNWRAIAAHAQPWLDAGVVVAGLGPDPLDAHVQFARRLQLPFKLLSDKSSAVARRYGVVRGKSARTMLVLIGRDGRVRYVDPAFAPRDTASYVHLDAAIQAAREAR